MNTICNSVLNLIRSLSANKNQEVILFQSIQKNCTKLYYGTTHVCYFSVNVFSIIGNYISIFSAI